MGASFYPDTYLDDYAGKACKDLDLFEKVNLFENEVSPRSFQTVLKYGGSSLDETNLLTLIRLGVIIADHIDSFSSTMETSLSSDRSVLHCDDHYIKVREYLMIRSNRKGMVPQDSLHKVKHLLPTATPRMLTLSLKIFCRSLAAVSSSISLER